MKFKETQGAVALSLLSSRNAVDTAEAVARIKDHTDKRIAHAKKVKEEEADRRLVECDLEAKRRHDPGTLRINKTDISHDRII